MILMLKEKEEEIPSQLLKLPNYLSLMKKKI
jgi:hypothetical protein